MPDEQDSAGARLQCPSCGECYERSEAGLTKIKAADPVTTVPLLDLKIQYLSIKDEVTEAINSVLESQRFILGPEVEKLEEEVGEYCHSKHAVGVSSGTDALLVSLMALGISGGDEVITTPFTFFATVGTVLRVGASVVFADINPETFNIDPDQVERAIGPRTKAIMPVHLFGQSADMDPILKIAEKHGLVVIEDAAQAIGTEYHGKRAGSMGTVGCFSFFPSKNLGAFGDGGMITTNDKALADHMRVIRDQGAKPKYYYKVVGGNFRLDALQAAVLRVKLKYLESWTESRRANAAFYTRRFQELGLPDNKLVPPHVAEERHIYNQYVIRAERRDDLKAFLNERGVGTEIYYPKALHLQECFAPGLYQEGQFPLSEAAAANVLALPVYPELTLVQKEYVVSAIQDFYKA